MIVFIFIQVSVSYAQQPNPYENDNFKLLPIKAKSKATEVIFKNAPTKRVLKTRDINPYLKLGLPFAKGNNEDSNPCFMYYDSSLHHIEMIDTLFNHGISKAGVSTSTSVDLFEKHAIVSYSIAVHDDEWNKTLKYGGKIYDKNGAIVFEAEGLPEKVVNLGQAQIDSTGKYLAAIRSDNFLSREDGHNTPLDFFLDIYSLPEMRLICTKEIPKDFVLSVHGNIFWISFSELDNARIPKSTGRHYYFYDLDKNKCFKLFLPRSLSFRGSRYEKAWAKDGIYVNNISDDPTFIKKLFDRDFIVEEIIKK